MHVILQCVYKHWKDGQESEENMYSDDYNKSEERAMEANSEKRLLADDVLCIVWCIRGTRTTLHTGTAAAVSAHTALE